jgi:Seryl-tRNA synthetase
VFVLSWSILEALRKQPEILKDSMRKRFIDVKVIDLALDLDIKWRAQLNKINSLRHEHNLLSEQISKEKEREKGKNC